MKIFKHLFFTLCLFYSSYSYSQWNELNSIPERTIQTLNFLDDDLGYAWMLNLSSGEYTLEKTNDGGATWGSLDLPDPIPEFQDIHFFAEGKGVILFRDQNNDSAPTRIYQTLDDGSTWSDITPEITATGVGTGKCQFLNQEVGFFATDRSLYLTQNGGVDWTVQEFTNYILALNFIDSDHGVMGTWDGTFVYKGGILATSDGGLSWTETNLDDNYTSIEKVQQLSTDLSFAAPIRGWSAIQARHLFKSTDGGETWNEVIIPGPTDEVTLKQMHFKDEMNGVICVRNNSTTFVYHTIDGGATWEEEGTVMLNTNTDMQLTENTGYISGVVGTFYKLNDLTATTDLLRDNQVNLFPSPAQSGHAISWTSIENFSTITIVNTDGRKIHQESLDQNKLVLPDLSAGLYLVKLSNDQSEVTKKLYVK